MLLPKKIESSRRSQIGWLTSWRLLPGQAYQCYPTMLSVVLKFTRSIPSCVSLVDTNVLLLFVEGFHPIHSVIRATIRQLHGDGHQLPQQIANTLMPTTSVDKSLFMQTFIENLSFR